MDADTWLAYYAFVNFGIFPDEVEAKSSRCRALAFEMAQKELKNRPK